MSNERFIFDAMNHKNVAELLDEDDLVEIGENLCSSIEDDMSSRQEWIDRNEQWMKLATQVMETKTFPWPNSANVKFPLLTQAAMQFHARAYPALVNKQPVQCDVIGADPEGMKRGQADRISRHMSYQVLYEIPDWEESMDRMCMILPLTGLAFKKTYYSPARQSPISELILPQDLIVNYNARSFEQAPRKTHVQWFHPNELIENERRGLFLEHEYGFSQTANEQNPIVAKTQGLKKGQPHEDDPHELFECHCWLDLDGDNYKEPYVVTLHREDRKVLRIAARYDDNSIETNDEGELASIRPIEHFTRFIFIPDPNSNIYGLGFGHLIGPTNEAANTIINQLLDAGTLSNLQSGFLAKGIRLKGGSTRFKPGEWKFVNSTAEDLAKGIYPLPVREPSNVLFQLLGLLLESGQQLASTTDIMVGENPGQNQPASTTMAVMEQGMKVFTGIYKRVHRAMSLEYRKMFYINSVYMEPTEHFRLNEVDEEIAQDDYNLEDLFVHPSADPETVTDTQKLLRAESLFPLVQMGTVNPVEATRRYLESQGHEEIEALMEMPEPQPDPEIELEVARFEHQRQLDAMKMEVEVLKARAMATRNEASAILNLARAESTEEHDRLDYYKAAVEEMQAREDMINERLNALSDMASTLQQQEEAPVDDLGADPAQQGIAPDLAPPMGRAGVTPPESF